VELRATVHRRSQTGLPFRAMPLSDCLPARAL